MAKSFQHQIIANALALISDEANWTRGALARDRSGLVCSWDDAEAYRYCAIGALARAVAELFGPSCEAGSMALRAAGYVLKANGKVAALQEACALEDRWYGFHQAEKRVGEGRLDEMARYYRDLKARLDKIEALAGGNYHAYRNFADVSRKLGELEHSREEAKRIARQAVFRAWLFCGTLLAAAAIVGLSVVLAGGHL